MVTTKKEQEEIQTVGAMLREARLKAGKTEAQIAEELCIRKTFVTAIEEMDFANIPPRPFGIGFIRSYAELVGLNSDRIVSSYRQSFHENKEEKVSEKITHTGNSSPRFKHIFFGLLGLAALFVVWSVLPLSEQVEDFQEDTASVIPEPVIVPEEEASAEDVVGLVDPNGDIVAVAITEEETSLEDQEEAVSPAVEDESSESSEENAIEETTAENSDTAKFHKMRMVLNGPSWIEVKQGDKTVLRGSVYKRGFSYDFPQEAGLSITVGKPRSVVFYVDDKPVKVVSAMNSRRVSLDSYLLKDND